MKNVLLVDDDEVFNMLNSRLLRNTNEVDDIHIAENGEDALSLLNSYYVGSAALPDVILLDLSMPVMDGFEFLRAFEMLSLPGKEEVTIVVVTSSADPEDKARVARFGITHFLTKPVSEEQLREVLHSSSGTN